MSSATSDPHEHPSSAAAGGPTTEGHNHEHISGHGHPYEGQHQHDGHDPDGHRHATGLKGFLLSVFRPHSHDAADSVDSALESSAEGIRALKISLIALGVTATAQLMVVILSGSVALLADTIHNFADALTAVPLWIAFVLVQRAPTLRYT